MACESLGFTSRGHLERAFASAACCASARQLLRRQPLKKLGALVAPEVMREVVDFARSVDGECQDACG
eukprot:462382-Pleurochrysis_carterae.AAC.1